MDLEKELFKLQDKKYKEFQSKLIPNINNCNIIGIRIPLLRKFTNEYFIKYGFKNIFNNLPHKYYEENLMHIFLIEKINNYDEYIKEIEKFLPYIDNWAVCDSKFPKILNNNKDKLIIKIKEWLKSNQEYTLRYSVKLLMDLYADDNSICEYNDLVMNIKSDKYYVNMMRAWYFQVALFKNWNKTIPYFENKMIDKWTHNKAIQKSIESYRMTSIEKNYLKGLKIK